MVCILAVLLLLTVSIVSGVIGITGVTEGNRLLVIAPTASILLLLSMLIKNWPLHLCYRISSAAFDDLARRIHAGEKIATPVRAGLYIVWEAGFSHSGVPCLWTWPHPAGNTGFVLTEDAEGNFNLWSSTRLDDDWQFITED
jgi:hypothetical protein